MSRKSERKMIVCLLYLKFSVNRKKLWTDLLFFVSLCKKIFVIDLAIKPTTSSRNIKFILKFFTIMIVEKS